MVRAGDAAVICQKINRRDEARSARLEALLPPRTLLAAATCPVRSRSLEAEQGKDSTTNIQATVVDRTDYARGFRA